MLSSQFQEIIDRRRSNRKFDPIVEVPDEVIKRSLERAILSPNSSNMQLWEFYWIKNKEEREKYTALCLGQSAAKTAKQIVVFVTRRDLWPQHAKWNYDRLSAAIVGEPNKLEKRGLDYYKKLMPLAYRSDFFGFFSFIRRCMSFFMGLTKPFIRFGGKADQRITVHKSCALAAQTFMLSIAAEGFESCPMEGFDQVRV
ncbi:MAG: nitroreductase family protein, partial [Sediminibacterium sp.]